MGICHYGVIIYYVVSIFLVVLLMLLEVEFVQDISDRILDLFGVLACYFTYVFIRDKMDKEKPQKDNTIDQLRVKG